MKKDDEKNGHGKFTWGASTKWSGHVYEGEYKDNKRNGHGKYTYANGNVYEGEWKDDKRV